jgi:hypothetical protein
MRRVFERPYGLLRVVGAVSLVGGITSCGGNSSLTTLDAPAAVVIADFNGDGFQDVAIAAAQIDESGQPGSFEEKGGYVALVLQDPSKAGTFQPTVRFATAGNPGAMAVGDLNHSGSPSLVVCNINQGSLSLLLQPSPHAGTFGPAATVPTGTNTSPTDVAIADVNGDGYNDIVVADGDINGGGMIVLLQNPSSPGTFSAPTEFALTTASGYSAPNSAYGIAAGSLTTTTAGAPPDVVMTSWQGNQTYENGTVSIFMHDPAHPGSFLAPTSISVPGALHRIKIADVNKDGLPDIILDNEGPDDAGLGSEGIVVILQSKTAPGTFEAPVTYTNPTSGAYTIWAPISLAIADVNGDGLPDIIWTSLQPSGTGSMQILLNTPASPGTFDTSNLITTSGLGGPVAVAAGQLGPTNLVDIATADGTGAVVYFQSTTTPGSFGAPDLVGG